MIKEKDVQELLDIMYPNPVCELRFNKDYELLIATVLSTQSTDKRVNEVTKVLFAKYDIYSLVDADIKDIESIIKSVGTYSRKSVFVKEIAKSLVKDYEGTVPNNRDYLESLPGVGRKTTNVVLSNLYNVPTIAVDTHVSRVAVRLELANIDDNLQEIEQKIMNKIPQDKWNRVNDQLVLFGRYTCKSQKPDCDNCLFNNKCQYKRSN